MDVPRASDDDGGAGAVDGAEEVSGLAELVAGLVPAVAVDSA
ncbi:hypothetical protein [Arthrobacter sp. AFG7.2]|nr:hypothetical protein [Arthrobacter sp. AFG7.2]